MAPIKEPVARDAELVTDRYCHAVGSEPLATAARGTLDRRRSGRKRHSLLAETDAVVLLTVRLD